MPTSLLTAPLGPLQVAGYIGAVAIGLSLGLIGGGGSILTVPVLVYLMGLDPVLATAYSLFVVGLTSLTGAVAYLRKGLVRARTAISFAAPSLVSVFLTRKFLVPALPPVLLQWQGIVLSKGVFIMFLFAVMMTMAAWSMIRKTKPRTNPEGVPVAVPALGYPHMFLLALGLGVLTGMVGAGGGFLIIPSLVFFARLDMKAAVGTSLLIIAINSLTGFTGDLTERPVDWPFLCVFSGLAISGILAGSYLSIRISSAKLKPAFGWFVLAMGCFIILKELTNL